MKKQLEEYLFRWSVILFFAKLNVKGHVNEDHMCACTDCFKARTTRWSHFTVTEKNKLD